jgi:hypothetical protein
MCRQLRHKEKPTWLDDNGYIKVTCDVCRVSYDSFCFVLRAVVPCMRFDCRGAFSFVAFTQAVHATDAKTEEDAVDGLRQKAPSSIQPLTTGT